MRNASPLAQWFIWLCILALITAVLAVADYYAYGFATHFTGVPENVGAVFHNPASLFETFTAYPMFVLSFGMFWIGIVVLIHLLWPPDITATLRWAALAYMIAAILTVTGSKLSNLVDDAFDEARVSNLLNGPDYRPPPEAGAGGPVHEERKIALAWQLTERPGMKPTPGELGAVTAWLQKHNGADASAIKMEKIYRAYYISPDVIRLLIFHPQTPPLVWSTMAESAVNRLGIFYYKQNDDLIAAIARDSRTSPKFLLYLLQMPEPTIQKEALANPKITPEVKQIYDTVVMPLRQASPESRLAAAQNPATPSYLLVGLGWDGDPLIRAAVAANPATPPYTLQRLAYDTDLTVKQTARATITSRSPLNK